MPSVALLPALPLIAGAAIGIAASASAGQWLLVLLPAAIATVAAWWCGLTRLFTVALAAAFFAGGGALGSDARTAALDTPLRRLLDGRLGGVALDSLGPPGDHEPVTVHARLEEDAAALGDYASLRAEALSVDLDGARRPARGGLRLSVSGSAFRDRVGGWRAGRVVSAPVTFRRPARYLNGGVADFERDLAVSGTTLLGSVKSGLLVDVVAEATAVQRWAGRVRSRVREAVARHVSPRGDVSGALVAAVLIGDRAGLPDAVRERLQRAGTYHVVAISGGNIAILAALTVAALALVGVRGRAAAWATVVVLLAYAQVAVAGPSVWRATAMAVAYLAARGFDHRTPPWQAMAVAAGALIVVQPLDVRDAGFVLTFGATAALLEGPRRVSRLVRLPAPALWVVASVAASGAVETVLMPVSAQLFSRVTAAGLGLNLAAVPLMAIVQVSGLVLAAFPASDTVAPAAGWTAHAAASALVGSASLVDAAPWLSLRVPPPGPLVLIAYYAGLALMLAGRRWWRRACGAAVLGAMAAVIVTGWRPAPPVDPGRLRLTMFDVGQAESLLLELPDGRSVLVDAGGAPFGEGLDIGARVLTPALWASGLRTLDMLVVTHGDPDHLGGAPVLIEEFRPRRLWEGIVVPRHEPMRQVRQLAARFGRRFEPRRSGEVFDTAGVRMRVLHPAAADWERPAVRNDDSVVLEVVYGDVAILLTGDISTAIERELVPQLTPAPIRILKVAHHGSRTSTSPELLAAWRPTLALISAGRGNSFGHPTPEVLSRLAAVGARVRRTDLHGQITIATDGHTVDATSYLKDVYEPRRSR